uniref:Genome polyprotein n=1 Tax=Bat picornavirus 6 TaxID=3038997 RepID=A0AAT9TY26_9PICO|nr:MAG: structural polyprotein [Bat picornavirus 6]
MCGFLIKSGTTLNIALWKIGHLPLAQMSLTNENSMDKSKESELRVDAPLEDDMRDIKSVDQSKEITEFNDEEEVQIQDYKQKVKEEKNPYVNQELSGFLSRPYPVATLSWKHSQARGSCIGRYVFPDMSFKVIPLWQKLQQFQYFRAGLCFTIKVNASVYHYGKLLCVWRPIALGKTTNDLVLGGPAAGYDNLYTLSSFPHVIIDANGCESNDFYVDFSLPFEWIDLSVWHDYNPSRKMMNMGVLEFWVLNSLYAMGQPTDPDAVITLFSSFTNPQVSGYTSKQHEYVDVGYYNGYKTNLMPTGFSYSDAKKKKSEESKGKNPIRFMEIPQAQSEVSDQITPINSDDSGYETDEEEHARQDEFIRRAVDLINRQGQYIDNVHASAPQMPSVFRLAWNWLKSRFLWQSLPQAQVGPDAGNNRMGVKEGMYKITQFPIQVASMNIDHAAIPMALREDIECSNERATTENGIRSFLSKPCLLHQFDITKTNKWGNVLMGIPVSPAWYPIGNFGNVADKLRYYTRVAYYARLFTFWRGTLRYHFNIVCSRFHSLRIRVYWMPGDDADGEKIYTASSAVNKIIDVEGCTDFYVDVPWLNKLSSLRYTESQISNNGYLFMDLLNPIVYPEANMPPVQVNVWISAGPDFEVDLLKKSVSYLSVPSWNKSGKENEPMPIDTVEDKKKEKKKQGIQAQAGDEISSGPIRGESSSEQLKSFIGEKIMTLQNLITKPTPFHKFAVNQNEISFVPNSREVTVRASSLFYMNNSLYEYFAVAFAGVSGAVRFHAMTLKGGSMGFIPEVTNQISFYRGKSGPSSVDDFYNQYGYTSVVVYEGSTVQRTVVLPYYSNCNYIPMTVVSAGGDMPDEVMFPLIRIDSFAAGDGAVLYTSAAENFYYHLPTGIPAMI